MARGSVAPKRSFMTVAQMRRAARSFAISSKKSEWMSKKNDSWDPKRSTGRPRWTHAST
jgi:hypothetical protein